jgi:hypothetical protein
MVPSEFISTSNAEDMAKEWNELVDSKESRSVQLEWFHCWCINYRSCIVQSVKWLAVGWITRDVAPSFYIQPYIHCLWLPFFRQNSVIYRVG